MSAFLGKLSPFPRRAFTIGMFDGVHLGHQALLHKLTSYGVPAAVLTFTNHPWQVLRPSEPFPLPIIPVEEKIRRLKTFNLEVIAIAFTKEFAALSYEELLEQMPLSHLVLGKGSAFGRAREGTEEKVRAWCQERKVVVEYLEKTSLFGEPISSGRIRKAIQAKDFSLVNALLGWSYQYV